MIKTVGNWNYAGTNKFVSHAQNEDGTMTLCGMDIHELMARRGQQWEEDETEGKRVGCLKCNRVLEKQE